MTTEQLIVISNAAVTLATIILTLATIVVDDRTITEIVRLMVGRSHSQGGKHERCSGHHKG